LAYGFGLVIQKLRTKKYLVLGLTINFGLLAYFKYFEFFSLSFQNLFPGVGDLSLGNIALPLGISFFTFQAASYMVDVYLPDVVSKERAAELMNPVLDAVPDSPQVQEYWLKNYKVFPAAIAFGEQKYAKFISDSEFTKLTPNSDMP
jgi:hypothetical protein